MKIQKIWHHKGRPMFFQGSTGCSLSNVLNKKKRKHKLPKGFVRRKLSQQELNYINYGVK